MHVTPALLRYSGSRCIAPTEHCSVALHPCSARNNGTAASCYTQVSFRMHRGLSSKTSMCGARPAWRRCLLGLAASWRHLVVGAGRSIGGLCRRPQRLQVPSAASEACPASLSRPPATSRAAGGLPVSCWQRITVEEAIGAAWRLTRPGTASPSAPPPRSSCRGAHTLRGRPSKC